MKTRIIFLLLIASIRMTAQTQEVQQTIMIFLKGFHSRDSLEIKKVCSNTMGFQSIVRIRKAVNFQHRRQQNFISRLLLFL